MVSFICDACGNTVKKTQVEKHYSTVCRNCSVLSCLDCGMDFPGDSYIKHTSCVTEAEKYQGHLYQAKEKGNKGETKQKEWLRNVHGTFSNTTDPKLKGLLKRLSSYANIPRKRKKFENFCKNSVNVYDTKTLDQLWDLFNASNEKSNTRNEEVNTRNEEANTSNEEAITSNEEANTSNEEANTNTRNDSSDCEENSTSETSHDGKTTQLLNGSVHKLHADSLPTTKKRRKKKKQLDEAIENDDVTNIDHTNENEEPVRKIKKKKKKHLINGDTSHDTEVVDCFADNVENVHETNIKSKKKKKKKEHMQVNMENEIEANTIEVQKTKIYKENIRFTHQIHQSSNVNSDKEMEKSQEEKKKKRGKKHKLKEEAIEMEYIEVKKKKKEENGATQVDKKENEEENLVVAPQGRFNWHKTIKMILKESEDHQLSLKKLRRKVLSAYGEHGIDQRASTMNQSIALFDKKLKSYPKVKILKDNVKLVD